MHCNQCEALMINGVLCHENGCPNIRARYDDDSKEWIKQYRCQECGFDTDIGQTCCTGE